MRAMNAAMEEGKAGVVMEVAKACAVMDVVKVRGVTVVVKASEVSPVAKVVAVLTLFAQEKLVKMGHAWHVAPAAKLEQPEKKLEQPKLEHQPWEDVTASVTAGVAVMAYAQRQETLSATLA